MQVKVPRTGKWCQVGFGHCPKTNRHFSQWMAIHPETGETISGEAGRSYGLPGGKKAPRNPPRPQAFPDKKGGKEYQKGKPVQVAAEIPKVEAGADRESAIAFDPVKHKHVKFQPAPGIDSIKAAKKGNWKPHSEYSNDGHHTLKGSDGKWYKKPTLAWAAAPGQDKAIQRTTWKNECLIPAIIERGVEQVINEIAFAEPKKRGAVVYVPHKAFYDWRDGHAADAGKDDMKMTREYLETMTKGKGMIRPGVFKHPRTGEPHHAIEFRDTDHAADFIDALKQAGVKKPVSWHHTGE